ncbi:uncharacterized protein LOC111121471 isoform X1 [Crassostrea virginica]|uniref:Uncharacterized protein LOC111121471 isoform X1 n=1 Tax=Crassostrea virginica TaxID=6565 RepID=A0A8B8CVI6_CRAVI|nr:uncharacterized protein LOC111121471 isoform X1 [Crassostrea virginica]XP_022318477.1 uncharacterized protein LOC111121471 isoform X1 [Crassostrea virginica]
MERSTVPLRHSGSQGSVRLPRRFAVPGSGDDSPDRLADLTRALCWIRQELIQLRQHDILLKRQFCDIQDTIRSLQKNRVPRHEIMSSTSSLQSTSSSVDITMENYGVRTATSATLLQECEDCVEDTISFSRPRTSSMKTIRDLAALARRRGSKEMI